jgi:uncharacterized membrane protein YeiH
MTIQVEIIQLIIEFLGTFAFAISGIRLAAAKHFDWFGGYVCGMVVAIGGGTIRDVLLGVTPFWMTNPVYIVCTGMALLVVILFSRQLKKLDRAWMMFDTLGLALFTIAGIQKSLAYGQPFWVSIIMGCITGAAGGIIRDVLLNNEPVIFRTDIYAMASVLGGICYWAMVQLHIPISITVIVSFSIVCVVRFLSIRYHITLPILHDEDGDDDN